MQSGILHVQMIHTNRREDCGRPANRVRCYSTAFLMD